MSFRAKLDVSITLFLVDSGCVTEYSTWLKRSSTQGIKGVAFQYYRIRKNKFYLVIFNILNICTSSGQIWGGLHLSLHGSVRIFHMPSPGEVFVDRSLVGSVR